MAMLLEHHKQLERLLTRLEAFCQRTLPAVSAVLERPQDPPALTGAVECLRAPQKGSQEEGASQGTLPYPAPLHAGGGGQAVEDGTQR